MLEIFISTNTIYNEWIAKDYFESGLFTGKAVVDAYFTGYALLI